ncbi:MAG TPA: S-methyl-5'-thioadenosine phosphorylase [Clostridia bacterium]|nr:S-methyl-5'-thioadenosine phosphorylase [Clostridia bacterium]
MFKAAIIGGTGIYQLEGRLEDKQVSTPYGEVRVTVQEDAGREIIFLARHGVHHHTPPHRVNYRGNIWALKELGVTHVFATNAVGSLNPKYKPGELVIFTDFIDFTKNRVSTFFDGQDGVIHTSMADPYCRELRRLITEKAPRHGIAIAGEAVYVGTEGPRFETAAEIRMYQKLGADVVGMTGIPEVVLAKELGLCYAGVGIITNWATGIAHDHRLEEIMGAVNKNRASLTNMFIDLIKTVNLDQNHCDCAQARMKM